MRRRGFVLPPTRLSVPHPFAHFANGWDSNQLKRPVPHPFAFFANGWDSNQPLGTHLSRLRHGIKAGS
jgi:hypothetical protein